MRLPKTNYVIAASSLALIALVVFQLKWLMDSHELIAEQLDQKLKMALCSAVENLDMEEVSCEGSNCCSNMGPQSGLFQITTPKPVSRERLDSAVAQAFTFYDIQLEYQINVIEEAPAPVCGSYKTYYQCSLIPGAASDKHLISMEIPNRGNYILGQMKFMLISSILILLFISSVFVFANYTLLRQKRIGQMNKDFFNNMAHEFRTPLTNISLAGRMLGRQESIPSDHKYLSIIQAESNKLKEQIDKVLQLTKLENGEYHLDKEVISPAELIRQVIDGMGLQIQEKKAEVNLQIKGDHPTLIADKFHLGNVFRNLLDNALKYAGEQPRIDISLEPKEQGVLIHFQDNGIGICPKEQSCIFDKYHRVSTGNVHNQKGFGIGLAYVKLIVEQHKGFVKVFSDLNKGTRFDLFLPA
ncbi:MAG: HAMP domain-containing sensor histidine kinase [Bacteroidota bacterium]